MWRVSTNNRRLYICNVFSHCLKPFARDLNVRTVSANKRRRYRCNVFSHWLKPFSCDLNVRTVSAKKRRRYICNVFSHLLKPFACTPGSGNDRHKIDPGRHIYVNPISSPSRTIKWSFCYSIYTTCNMYIMIQIIKSVSRVIKMEEWLWISKDIVNYCILILVWKMTVVWYNC